MKIAIDLQACQTPGSASRGIGRYSLELARAVVGARGPHEIALLYNEAFDASAITRTFGDTDGVSLEGYRVVGADGETGTRRQAIQRIDDEILNWRYACTGADVIHVSSLFEGWQAGGEHVSGRLADVPCVLRTGTLYDLIPLLLADAYLPTAAHRRDYLSRLAYYRQLDIVFAISEATRRDAVERLRLPAERVVTLGAGCSETFRPLGPPTAEDAATLAALGLSRPFVLYTGGADVRKNVDGLLRAFAALPNPPDVALAIVCEMSEDYRRGVMTLASSLGIADRVVLPGYVPDETLNVLYNRCDLFAFPSLYEGFGLPLLEAMACGACVLASSTSSMPEIVGRDDLLFDPRDTSSLAAKMSALLGDPDARARIGRECRERAARFTWSKAATRMIAAIEDAQQRRAVAAVGSRGPRSRVALHAPLPPQQTGIADYCASMLPYWSRHFDLDLVVDGPAPTLREDIGRPVTPATFEREAASYDAVLYHLGNSPFHADAYRRLQRHPGIVVLHDVYLSGLVNWIGTFGGDDGLFQREILASHGESAGRELLDRARTPRRIDELIARHPASREVLQHATGVVFHSRFAERLMRSTYPELAGVPTAVIPLASVVDVDPARRAGARERLGLAASDVLVCAFGFIVPTKEPHILLEALLDRRLAGDVRLRVVFVGDWEPGAYQQRLEAMIGSHPLRERIAVTGFVEDVTFEDHLAACDVAVTLRSQSHGETSSALLKQLRAGCATVATDLGAIAELPDDVIVKVPRSDPSALAAALVSLLADGDERAMLGARARTWTDEHAHPARVAERYAEVLPALQALDRARSAREIVQRVAGLSRRDGVDARVSAAASEAIAAGIARHPSSARWLPRLFDADARVAARQPT